jgi:formylmethanofuran dehydrogenase subunit E
MAMTTRRQFVGSLAEIFVASTVIAEQPAEIVEIIPCDECGHPVVFPKQIHPGEDVAVCRNCGCVYADADEEENEWFLRSRGGA